MMRLRRMIAIWTTAMVMAGGPVAASPVCGIVDILMQALIIEEQALDELGTPYYDPASFRKISILLERAQRMGLGARQLQGDLSPEQTKILGFIASRGDMLQAHILDPRTGVRRHVRMSPDHVRYGQMLRQMALTLDCSGAGASGGVMDATTGITPEARGDSMTGSRQIGVFNPSLIAFTIFAGGVSALIYALVFMRMGARRKMQRYRVNTAVEIYMDDEPEFARMVNISRTGAQISLQSGLSAGKRLDLELRGARRPAQVVWTNQHYAGLQFDKLLSRDDVRVIVGV